LRRASAFGIFLFVSTSSNGQSGTAPKPELGIRFTWDAQFAHSVGIIKLRGNMVQLSAGHQPDELSSEDIHRVLTTAVRRV